MERPRPRPVEPNEGAQRARPVLTQVTAVASSRELVINRDWQVVEVTPAAALWFGAPPEALIGRNIRDGFPLPPAGRDAISASFATDRPVSIQFASAYAPGRWVDLHVQPGPEGAHLVFEDITDRLVGETDARAEPRPAAALAMGPWEAEIVLLDCSGRIVSANDAWRRGCAEFGLGEELCGPGSNYVELFKLALPDFDDSLLRVELEDLFAGRRPQFTAACETGPPGEGKLRQMQITALEMGGARLFVAIHEDLSERARVAAALRDTSEQLLTAQEEERQRIALELHDSTSQHLAALSLGVLRLKRMMKGNGAVAEVLADMNTAVREAIQETRVLSYLMKPAGAAEGGVEDLLRRFVEGFARRTRLDATFICEGSSDEASPAARHALFRVVQEALSNVFRHAQARRVEVKLTVGDDILTARIADDGKGMDLSTRDGAPLGVGLFGMRARMEQLGGALRVESGTGGTVITATVPVCA